MSANFRRGYFNFELSPEVLSCLLGNRTSVYTYFVLVIILDQNNVKDYS